MLPVLFFPLKYLIFLAVDLFFSSTLHKPPSALWEMVSSEVPRASIGIDDLQSVLLR